jgi:hypothetical protein
MWRLREILSQVDCRECTWLGRCDSGSHRMQGCPRAAEVLLSGWRFGSLTGFKRLYQLLCSSALLLVVQAQYIRR